MLLVTFFATSFPFNSAKIQMRYTIHPACTKHNSLNGTRLILSFFIELIIVTREISHKPLVCTYKFLITQISPIFRCLPVIPKDKISV